MKLTPCQKKKPTLFVSIYCARALAPRLFGFFFYSNVPGLESFLMQRKSDLTSKRSVYRCTLKQKAILFPGEFY